MKEKELSVRVFLVSNSSVTDLFSKNKVKIASK